MDVTAKHTFSWLVVASAICAGLGVLVYLPFLVPAVVVIIWLKFRGAFAMVPYFIYLGVTFLLGYIYSSVLTSVGLSVSGFPVLYTVLFVCLTFPAAIVSVLMHRSGKRMYDSVLWTTLASFFGVGIFIALVYVYTEQSITDILLNALSHVLNTNADFMNLNYAMITRINQALGSAAAGASTTDIQKITYITELYNEALPIYLSTIMISFGLLSGLISYYLPFLFLRNKEVKLTPCPAFKDLRVPNPERIILIVVFLAATFINMAGAYNLQVLASVMRSAVTLVFTVQGLAFLTYLYKGKRIGLVFYIFLIIIGFLFNVIFWLGILESVMKMRSRIDLLEKSGGE